MPTDPACRPWSRRDSLAELDAHDDGDLDVAAPDAEVRPRRSRLPVALALAGVALVLAGGAIVLGDREPLAPVVALQVSDDVLHDVIMSRPQREAIAVVYDHDQPSAFAITLRNDGSVPITVTDIGIGVGERHLIDPYGAFVLPAGADIGDGIEGDLLGEFRLGAGEERVVVIRGVFDNCRYYNERNIDLRSEIEVEFRTFGVTNRQTLLFDRDLAVKSPMIVSCPERTINREDDRLERGISVG